jgi:hypothetical protein
MWIHERFDIGRPRADLSEYHPLLDGTDPADLPTMGSLWCLLTVYFGTPSMFITLWFGFDYGTNPPLGTLII